MDWDEPSGPLPEVKIGFVRLSARDPERRIGNLFHNPGGPVELPSDMLLQISRGQRAVLPEILDRFDFVGVDLRGTGLSDALHCGRPPFEQLNELYTDTKESLDGLVKANQEYRQSCLTETGSPLFD
ncbi:uncharacterized protein LTR77_008385 [Saxophila tyrrhenica]|uniref:Alpha/beta hydrolase n=1 Tax=Saxophila tyrrhenica TaxID=1690608 RepID=A0AAV9P2Q7_9PEZI|nr:hypothetical protein LTR77_008385 [Saxophila tyrrhenica]